MSRIFGQIAQIGYVVTDVEASMQQWIRHCMGQIFAYIRREAATWNGAEPIRRVG